MRIVSGTLHSAHRGHLACSMDIKEVHCQFKLSLQGLQISLISEADKLKCKKRPMHSHPKGRTLVVKSVR